MARPTLSCSVNPLSFARSYGMLRSGLCLFFAVVVVLVSVTATAHAQTPAGADKPSGSGGSGPDSAACKDAKDKLPGDLTGNPCAQNDSGTGGGGKPGGSTTGGGETTGGTINGAAAPGGDKSKDSGSKDGGSENDCSFSLTGGISIQGCMKAGITAALHWFWDNVVTKGIKEAGQSMAKAAFGLPDPSGPLTQLFNKSAKIVQPGVLVGLMILGLLTMLRSANYDLHYATHTGLPNLAFTAAALAFFPDFMTMISKLSAGLATDILGQAKIAEAVSALVSDTIISGLLTDSPVVGAIVGIALLIMAVLVAAMAVFKSLLFNLLFICGPFALILYPLPGFSGVTTAWFRGMAACAIIPILFTLEITVGSWIIDSPQLLFGQGANQLPIFSSLAALMVLYIMAKTPFKVIDWAFASFGGGRGFLRHAARNIAIGQLMRSMPNVGGALASKLGKGGDDAAGKSGGGGNPGDSYSERMSKGTANPSPGPKNAKERMQGNADTAAYLKQSDAQDQFRGIRNTGEGADGGTPQALQDLLDEAAPVADENARPDWTHEGAEAVPLDELAADNAGAGHVPAAETPQAAEQTSQDAQNEGAGAAAPHASQEDAVAQAPQAQQLTQGQTAGANDANQQDAAQPAGQGGQQGLAQDSAQSGQQGLAQDSAQSGQQGLAQDSAQSGQQGLTQSGQQGSTQGQDVGQGGTSGQNRSYAAAADGAQQATSGAVAATHAAAQRFNRSSATTRPQAQGAGVSRSFSQGLDRSTTAVGAAQGADAASSAAVSAANSGDVPAARQAFGQAAQAHEAAGQAHYQAAQSFGQAAQGAREAGNPVQAREFTQLAQANTQASGQHFGAARSASLQAEAPSPSVSGAPSTPATAPGGGPSTPPLDTQVPGGDATLVSRSGGPVRQPTPTGGSGQGGSPSLGTSASRTGEVTSPVSGPQGGGSSVGPSAQGPPPTAPPPTVMPSGAPNYGPSTRPLDRHTARPTQDPTGDRRREFFKDKAPQYGNHQLAPRQGLPGRPIQPSADPATTPAAPDTANYGANAQQGPAQDAPAGTEGPQGGTPGGGSS